MLQQNNNNNHHCLDVAHRELLHECRRTNVSFTSALEFGAIPLIKGLRAWAVNGGYSRARRKAATAPRAQGTCQQPPENRLGQRSWSGQISSVYGQTLESTTSTRTPGVRQDGLGALVTVATLKGKEGDGRQTQTRCLFLKAQGRGSYICAVGHQGAGMRVTVPRTHSVILEGTKKEIGCSSKGLRASQDGTDDGGVLKAKPRAIRKWRKCSKTTCSSEKRTTKVDITNQCCEPGHGDHNNSAFSKVTLGPVNRTSHNTMSEQVTQCETEENNMERSNTTSHGVLKLQSQEYELSKDERAHSPTSVHIFTTESTDPQSCCFSAKPCADTGEQVEGLGINPSDKCFKSCEGSNCANDHAQRDTEVCKRENHQNTETKNKDGNIVADEPKLERSSVVSKTSETIFDSPEIKRTTINCSTEPSLGHALMMTSSEVPVNSIQENQESRTNEYSWNCENQHSVETGDLTTPRCATPDTMITTMPEGFTGQVYTLVGVECNSLEKCKSPMCSPQQWEELIAEHGELEVHQPDKSSLRGFSMPTSSIILTTIHSLPNRAPTTTEGIATAIPALSKGEVGDRGGDLLPLVNSEFLTEPERVDERENVATDEGSLDVGEEEDEFGAFMQADGKQLLTDGFQQLATGKDYKTGGLTSSTNANEPTSWTSDWTTDQSFLQSESTWTAFSQETVEQKIVPGGQWWPTTVEKPNLSLSPLCDVSSVFLEAFSSEKPYCQDPDYIPTLKQLLQGPAENGNTGEPREQSLLDGLQDLDRMIGVKYKRAESLSCKLLLQSLHLERSSSECVTVRVKTSARFSPNLPASNQQLAANAKRRLSYDFNRNIMT
ncbi:uncharacterized protein LOC127455743 [Myxocyprinus asiaticus]|uniref:uncharacterized protein LOC127455743 n=1 Tax=Myxocyprinus asiaticus TaxID=70543 RepID=UPI0022217FDF|nr:uncharacterized protein LOC127455743 [Myxocyprinus asiaticus]XP_051579803.1 uncharacterized protein LOC127455743 [Myxocyprinus asiaticus]